MRRGLFLSIVAAMMLASGFSYGQSAGPYPTRQVRIVVPYPAGGPTDLIARLVAQKLGERLGQSFFVENVAGERFCRRVGDEHQPAVRSGEEFLAGHHHRHLAASGGGQSIGAGEKHERAGRPHQGRAGEI
jgi:hypothetical protein